MNIKNNTMTNRIFILLILTILLYSCHKEDKTIVPSNKLTFSYGGQNREYILHKPSNLPANAPLVFVLHGYTQTAEWASTLGFNQIADTAKFVVCYPQGLNNAWKNYAHNSEDVGFLKALAQSLQTELSLNTNKTFATGFSQGGSMCNLLAIDASNLFKAVAPVAGFFEQNVWTSTTTPQSNIPYFAIHGTSDQIIPINGSQGSTGWQGGPAIQIIVDYWKVQNNCTTTDNVQFTANTTAYHYRSGTNGKEVWFYKINGQGHVFPGDPKAKAGSDISGFNASVEIWKFFRKW
jgi:polyhydroxybutyrate depolymerase